LFTWTVNNTGAGSLNQVVAYLDAIATLNADINAHATNTNDGQTYNVWYRYTGAGKIQALVGTGAAADIGSAGEGLFIESLVGSDKLNVEFIDDAGDTLTYPFQVTNTVTVGTGAVADTNAWVHCFFRDGADNAIGGGDDFNSSGAVTVATPDATDVKSDLSTLTQSVTEFYRTATEVLFVFDHTGDTVGGSAGENKYVVFECEGDGGVTAAKTIWQITNASPTISVSCVPGVETNV
ncbi:MAG: hypothetical protein DRQ62_01580, partial [Gammaproteobacteria bacterium]